MPFGSPLCLSRMISPPNGFGVSFRNASEANRRAVRDCAVASPRASNKPDCSARLCPGPNASEQLRLPERFDPAAARDPFARLRLLDTRFTLREIFEAGCAFEVQSDFSLAHAAQV
jgi:hypothetical protein